MISPKMNFKHENMELSLECNDEIELVLPSYHHDPRGKDSNHPEMDIDVNGRRRVVQTAKESLSRLSSTIHISKETESFKEMGLEAERLQIMFKDVDPELSILDTEVAELCRTTEKSFVKNDPRVIRLICELEILKNYIAKSKTDLFCMKSYVTSLLCSIDKASTGYSGTDQPEKAKMLSEQIELSNMEDDLQDSSSDCESLTTCLGNDILRNSAELSHSQMCMTHTKVEESNAKSKLCNQSPNKGLPYSENSVNCKSNACLKKHYHKNSPEPLHVTGSVVKCMKSKTLFTCHLCGFVTENGNDHMEKIHPDQKEFICLECGKVFDDFENMWHHRGIHKLRQTRMNKSKLMPLPAAQCDICGKVLKNQKILKEHKLMHSREKPFHCEVCGKRFARKRSARVCKHREQVKKKIIIQHACKICDETLESKGLLRIHEKQVHNIASPEKWPCLICDDVFDSSKDLDIHLPVHSLINNEPLKCKFCEENFSTPSSLRKHLFQHSKNFACEICGKNFFKASSFYKHKKFHMEQVTCQVCGRVLRSASRLKEHMNVHTGEKPYECDLCHMKLSSRCALSNHKARAHSKGNGGNKCYICGKAFRTAFARNSHHLEHTEEERRLHNVVVKMFTCNICGKTMRKEYKVSHLKKHKSKSERICICEICGKEFFRLSELRFHMITHTGSGAQEADMLLTKKERKLPKKTGHVCDICGKEFGFRVNLEYHKVVHSDERPFKCSVCSKSFKLKHFLKLHETIHTGSEPFRCSFCGKAFIFRASFESHLRTHSREKPFACHVCGARFGHEGNMVRHISSVHKNERKFKCDVCDKSFNLRSALKIHHRIHTGEKPHTCDICGISFSDPSTLYKHKATHAKNSSKTETLNHLSVVLY